MPTVLETYIENRWMVQPNHSNHLGSTHGGTVLKWMDELGAMSAMRFAGEPRRRANGRRFARPLLWVTRHAPESRDVWNRFKVRLQVPEDLELVRRVDGRVVLGVRRSRRAREPRSRSRCVDRD